MGSCASRCITSAFSFRDTMAAWCERAVTVSTRSGPASCKCVYGLPGLVATMLVPTSMSQTRRLPFEPMDTE
jgi:hypothetical protein